MKAEQEETRKGPWTEQEDAVLVNFVHLFGDRRWDFIAKVSGLKVCGGRQTIGLNRTGKSCRLRWVNYLHPGLKREKMSPQEQRLVLNFMPNGETGFTLLHLQSSYDFISLEIVNLWSRIARKLPGRTDNEIKNYWRTHMRKKSSGKEKAMPKSLSPSSSSSSITLFLHHHLLLLLLLPTVDSLALLRTGKVSFTTQEDQKWLLWETKAVQISKMKRGTIPWMTYGRIFDMSEENMIKPLSHNYSEEGCNIFCPSMASPSLDYCWDSLWKMDDEESKMFLPFSQSILALNMGHLFFNQIG
ncbi:hypothetical protein CXB51_009050 [Gossypium anomalum]|uniref:Uncharacterized protein n=1 Tax=Gossypium anomalum TaxID=47600 RepID=A0A8J5YU80_9ROSI|nr:hypothetical protein CXB51_009050 [Gossypium anomalum]